MTSERVVPGRVDDVDNGLQSLAEIATTYAWRKDSDEPKREEFERQWSVFRATHAVVDHFFCRESPGACIHVVERGMGGHSTDEDQLLLLLPVDGAIPDWTTQLLLDCRTMQIEIRQVLGPPSSRFCTEMVFSLIVQLLRQADAHVNQVKPDTKRVIKLGADAGQHVYEEQLAAARGFYERAALRVAQNRYFLGMLVGVAFLFLIVAGVLGVQTTTFRWTLIENDVQFLVAAIVVGGLGAIVSVMQRLTTGHLQLPYRASQTEMLLYGFFRPVIGAVFGTLVFVVLRAGLIAIAGTPPTDDMPRLLYFYVALAFFAGFSERWAQDVLAASGVKLETTDTSPKPAEDTT